MIRVQNIHERHEPITYHDAGHFIELSWATHHDFGRVLSCPGQKNFQMSKNTACTRLLMSALLLNFGLDLQNDFWRKDF